MRLLQNCSCHFSAMIKLATRVLSGYNQSLPSLPVPPNITKTIFPPLEDKMFLDCVADLSINISDRAVALCSIKFEDVCVCVSEVGVGGYLSVNVFVWSVCPGFFKE